ncbi:MAG: C10 family peptidase [Bacteroidales bacterium]|nr:C10 family peptidase [Bacteroidales bacterium]
MGYENVDLKKRQYYFQKKWIKLIKDELDLGHPILYAALDEKITEGSHAFIIDGYKGDLFHINWGWGENNSNSYFSLNDFTGGNTTYNFKERMITNIYPTNIDDYCDKSIDLGHYYFNESLYGKPLKWQAIPIGANLHTADTTWPVQYRTITSNDDIVYMAYNSIVLRQGFSVKQGGRFHAYLTNCPFETKFFADSLKRPINSLSNQIIEPVLSISPNPLSSTAQISYFLPQKTNYSIEIYDIFGKKLKQVEQGHKTKGNYQCYINLSDLQNGLYFCVLKTSQSVLSEKIVKI